MSDIPKDIDDAAAECWGTLPKESAGIRHIARAILAERERCAGIARWHAQGVLEDAIRSGQPNPSED